MVSGLFIALAAGFVILLNLNRSLYDEVLFEDGPVEYATSVLLFVAAFLFAVATTRHWKKTRVGYFLAVFAALLFVAALEEISWGQRLLQIPSPEFFIVNNDQQEINIHNTLQHLFSLKTKHLVGVGLLLYGVVIPRLLQKRMVNLHGFERYVVFPPSFLSVGIVVGALFMADVPTTHEEEIGEFLLSLSLCVFGGHTVGVWHWAAAQLLKPGAQKRIFVAGLLCLGTAAAAYGMLQVRFGPTPVGINVRWAPGVGEAIRQEAEQRYSLSQGVLLEERTWRYTLSDPSRTNVRALVSDAVIEDTHEIDRTTSRVSPSAPKRPTPPPWHPWVTVVLRVANVLCLFFGLIGISLGFIGALLHES